MIYQKLFELQNRIGAISKDAENPFFHSKYFDINKLIECLKPHLKELGLLIIQPIECGYEKNIISTIIIEVESPEKENHIKSEFFLPDNIDPQKMGSAITYYRRYALQSMLFLQAEDDDGNNVKIPEKTPVVMSTKPYAMAMPMVGKPELFCKNCGGNMKHLKGVSKTSGKPYDFHTCESCKTNVYPPK